MLGEVDASYGANGNGSEGNGAHADGVLEATYGDDDRDGASTVDVGPSEPPDSRPVSKRDPAV
jgi:hypothetical protein